MQLLFEIKGHRETVIFIVKYGIKIQISNASRVDDLVEKTWENASLIEKKNY